MRNLLTGWKPGRTEYTLISPEGKHVEYSKYRQITGLCETCGLAVAGHPRCDGCDIWCGTGHEESLSVYRGKKLCGHCITNWKVLDKTLGRKADFVEFRMPKLKMLRWYPEEQTNKERATDTEKTLSKSKPLEKRKPPPPSVPLEGRKPMMSEPAKKGRENHVRRASHTQRENHQERASQGVRENHRKRASH